MTKITSARVRHPGLPLSRQKSAVNRPAAGSLGFESLADLLNIKRVDQARARWEGWRTLSDLVAIHDLENSAERRGDEWGDGSPFYQASLLALVEIISTTPEGTLPDPFAPGAPFGPKLPPVLSIVGQ